ncbi:MAG TPA: hypothetical protein VGM01_03500 [Ktedonobacteraceae bacterium]
MTYIWYEVFPVTLVDKHPTLLQDAAHPACSPWMVPQQPNIHPNTVVIDYLATLLGKAVYSEKTIVHSTSWRYDAAHDWILLTYLAILPQAHWQVRLQPTSRITLTPVGEITAQYGDQLFPPEQIERQHVLAHALDHLASLNTYDLSIQTTLEIEWQTLLRSRQPKPAGCLQRSPHLASSPALHADEIAIHTDLAQPAVLIAST